MGKISLILFWGFIFFVVSGFNFFGRSKKEKAAAEKTQTSVEQSTAPTETAAGGPKIEVVEVRDAAGEPAVRPRELSPEETAKLKEDMKALQGTLDAIRSIQGLSGAGGGGSGGGAAQAAGVAKMAVVPSVAQIPETTKSVVPPIVSAPQAIPKGIDTSVARVQEVARLAREIVELRETLKKIEEEKKRREEELRRVMERQQILEAEEAPTPEKDLESGEEAVREKK